MKMRTAACVLLVAAAGARTAPHAAPRPVAKAYDSAYLGDTALLIAETRAVITRLDPHYLSDPIAQHVVGERRVAKRMEAIRSGRVSAASLGRIAVRVRFFDREVEAFAGRHRRCQVVLLGAGYDARAQRLYLGPGCGVFACDAPAVIRRRRRCGPLARARLRCGFLAHVACDLCAPRWIEALRRAPGYDASLPTCFVAEGLLYYLEPGDVAALVRAVAAEAAPGSRLLASLISRGALERARGRGAPLSSFRWGVDEPRRFLRRLGCGRGRIYELGRAPCDDWWKRHPPRDVRPPRRFEKGAPRTWYASVRLGGRRRPRAPPPPRAAKIPWSADAAATLARVPFFVRGLVERKTEAYAAAANSRVVTAEVLAAAKAHNGR